jgi:hypothetical protein
MVLVCQNDSEFKDGITLTVLWSVCGIYFETSSMRMLSTAFSRGRLTLIWSCVKNKISVSKYSTNIYTYFCVSPYILRVNFVMMNSGYSTSFFGLGLDGCILLQPCFLLFTMRWCTLFISRISFISSLSSSYKEQQQ